MARISSRRPNRPKSRRLRVAVGLILGLGAVSFAVTFLVLSYREGGEQQLEIAMSPGAPSAPPVPGAGSLLPPLAKTNEQQRLPPGRVVAQPAGRKPPTEQFPQGGLADPSASTLTLPRDQGGAAGTSVLTLPGGPNSPVIGSPATGQTLTVRGFGGHTFVIHRAFEGCWQGDDSHIEYVERLGGPPSAGWVPESFRLCFRRSGGRMLDVTFAKAYVTSEQRAKAAAAGNTRIRFGPVTVLSAGRADTVSLRIVESYDMRTGFPEVRAQVKGPFDLNCELRDGGRALSVTGQFIYRCGGASMIGCDGGPWIRGEWHGRFARVAD